MSNLSIMTVIDNQEAHGPQFTHLHIANAMQKSSSIATATGTQI